MPTVMTEERLPSVPATPRHRTIKPSKRLVDRIAAFDTALAEMKRIHALDDAGCDVDPDAATDVACDAENKVWAVSPRHAEDVRVLIEFAQRESTNPPDDFLIMLLGWIERFLLPPKLA